MSSAFEDLDVTAARALALHVTNPGRYGDESPLNKLLKKRISDLTDEIAREVIAGTPQLRSRLQSEIEETVARLLKSDSYLMGEVVRAVSTALAQVKSERSDDES